MYFKCTTIKQDQRINFQFLPYLFYKVNNSIFVCLLFKLQESHQRMHDSMA